MPAIYVFRKRTLLGGDDLQVPCLLTALVRITQLLCLILPLSIYIYNQAIQYTMLKDDGSDNNNHHHKTLLGYLFYDFESQDDSDDDDNNYCVTNRAHNYPLLSTIFLLESILFSLVSLLLEYQLYHWSCQGTPTIRQPRSTKVERLLETKLISTIVGLLIVVTTFVVGCTYAKTYHNCYRRYMTNGGDNQTLLWVSSQSWYILGALLVLSQSTELCMTTILVGRLISYKGPSMENDGLILTTTRSQHELIEEMWADRCSTFFYCLSVSTCFLFGGHDLVLQRRRTGASVAAVTTTASRSSNHQDGTASSSSYGNNIYQHVAQALADYLETNGTLDVVPTDLVTGLLVLQRLQRQRILQARRHVIHHHNTNQQQHEQSSSSLLYDDNNHTTTATASTLIVSSPETQTGLRSRVASSNDLKRQSSSQTSSNGSTGDLVSMNNGGAAAVTAPIVASRPRSKSPPPLQETARLVPTANTTSTTTQQHYYHHQVILVHGKILPT